MITSRKEGEDSNPQPPFPLNELPASIFFLIAKNNFMEHFRLFSQTSKKYYHLVHGKDYWLGLIKEQFPFICIDTYISRPDCDWSQIFRHLEITYQGVLSHKFTAMLFYFTKRHDLRSLKRLFITPRMLKEKDGFGMKAADYARLAGYQDILNYFYQLCIPEKSNSQAADFSLRTSIEQNGSLLCHAILYRQPIDEIKALLQKQIDLHQQLNDDSVLLENNRYALYKAAMTQPNTQIFLWLQDSGIPFKLNFYEGCFTIAAKIGNAECAKLLLGIHPNQFAPPKAMLAAASLGHAAFLASVLSCQPAISYAALLHVAAKCGHVDCVKVICEYAPSQTLSDELFFINPFKSAISNGHLRCAQTLLSLAPTLQKVLQKDIRSCLIDAANGGHVGVIKWMYELGVDLGQALASPVARQPSTILSLAAYLGHIHLLEFMLIAGFNTNSIVRDSPLYFAAFHEHIECTKLLLKVKDIKSIHGDTLNTIVIINNIDLLQICLDQGVNLNLPSSLSLTPLMMAAAGNFIEVTQFLLDSGVNIEAVDNGGNTALGLAIINKANAVIEILLKFGANPNHRNDANKTIFELAINTDDEAVVSLLIEYGALIPSIVEKLPVLAAVIDHPKIFALLLKRGAAVDEIIPDNGITILMHAIKCDKIDAVKLLIESGVNLHYVNSSQQSALSYALRYSSSLQILKMLEERQVNLTQNLPDSMPPIFYAAAFANSSLVAAYFLKKGISPTTAHQFDRETLMRFAALSPNVQIQQTLQAWVKQQDGNVIHLSPVQIAELFDCTVSLAAFDFHIRQSISHKVIKPRY